MALALLHDREPEDAPRPRIRQGRVREVSGIRLARAQREDEQVGGDEHEECHRDRGPAPALESRDDDRDSNRRQRRDREVRQREETPRDARIAEGREDVAQGLVERQVRPEREQHRDQGGEAEQDCEPPPAACEQHKTGSREHGQQPAEEDEALRPVQAPPAHEVDRAGGKGSDLFERSPFGLR